MLLVTSMSMMKFNPSNTENFIFPKKSFLDLDGVLQRIKKFNFSIFSKDYLG